MRRLFAAVLAAALGGGAPGVQAADLLVWWQAGFYAQEDAAVGEIVAAFEQETGSEVDLVRLTYEETEDKIRAALAAGRPPDFVFPFLSERWVPQWAEDGLLVDLAPALGPLRDVFDADAIDVSTLRNGVTDGRGLYALPMGRFSNHVHVWRDLLEQAGLEVDEIPSEWRAFWRFWCDRAQPAVRRALGRDDIWGIGLPMSDISDTEDQLLQFQLGHDAPWLSGDRRLQVDDPSVRAGLIAALDDYVDLWRKGCTPPDAASWSNLGNNEAFLARRVLMTANASLSIPAKLRTARPDDYYHNAVTVDWPNRADGAVLATIGGITRAGVFKGGGNPALAERFVRFLVEDGWLAHWLNFAGDRFLPPMRKLVEQPFWLDPSDPHRMRAAIQILSRPPHNVFAGVRDQEARSSRVLQENLWGKAVHRVVADGIPPEQAVDDAIARIKHILAE